MNTRLLVKHLGFFAFSVALAWYTYIELLGWSASLALPDFMMEHYKEIGGVDDRYEFAFILLTWYLPYSLIAGALTYCVSKFIVPWVVPAGYLIVTFFMRGFNYGFWFWLAMFILVGAVTLGLSILLANRSR